MVVTLLMRKIPPGGLLRTLAYFGNYSMLVYVLHQAIGRYVIKNLLDWHGVGAIESIAIFLMAVLLTLCAIAAACGAISVLKRRYHPRSVFLQVLIGR
jgi:fucose 4-O-acetylase-like acetyltransferase